MLERDFQSKLIKEIKDVLGDMNVIVMKNDPNYIQGIPDLVILGYDRWAALEVKKSAKEPHRPNQDWYVERMDDMSFARFIFPENKAEVMDELHKFFTA